MKTFIGRERELSYLEELYSTKGVKTCAIYGKRQVGKTALIQKFCEGKRSLYIQFNNASMYENLKSFKINISDFLGHDVGDFDSLGEYMDVIKRICEREPTVVVFDELPYLISEYPASASILQAFIDVGITKTETMVIICGSSVSIMMEEINNVNRPLYGRFMSRIELNPMSLRETIQFHPGMSDMDIVRTYLIVGGIPKYHNLMDKDTFEESFIDCFLGFKHTLLDEGANICSEGLTPLRDYTSLLTCISDGAVRQNHMADKLGLSRVTVKNRLDRLESLGIVERVNPMFDSPSKPVYRIRDNMVAFHYRVISNNEPLFRNHLKSPEDRFERLRNTVNTFMGLMFEDVCKAYVEEEYITEDIGRWWGRVDEEDVDIDVAAYIYDGHATRTMLAECKFRNKPTGFGTLNELQNRADGIHGLKNTFYVLFSASGFTSELEEYAEDNGIVLVDLKGLLGRNVE